MVQHLYCIWFMCQLLIITLTKLYCCFIHSFIHILIRHLWRVAVGLAVVWGVFEEICQWAEGLHGPGVQWERDRIKHNSSHETWPGQDSGPSVGQQGAEWSPVWLELLRGSWKAGRRAQPPQESQAVLSEAGALMRPSLKAITVYQGNGVASRAQCSMGTWHPLRPGTSRSFQGAGNARHINRQPRKDGFQELVAPQDRTGGQWPGTVSSGHGGKHPTGRVKEGFISVRRTKRSGWKRLSSGDWHDHAEAP